MFLVRWTTTFRVPLKFHRKSMFLDFRCADKMCVIKRLHDVITGGLSRCRMQNSNRTITHFMYSKQNIRTCSQTMSVLSLFTPTQLRSLLPDYNGRIKSLRKILLLLGTLKWNNCCWQHAINIFAVRAEVGNNVRQSILLLSLITRLVTH